MELSNSQQAIRKGMRVFAIMVIIAAIFTMIVPCGTAAAKQSVSVEMQQRVEKAMSRNATTIHVKQGWKITRTKLATICTRVRYKKASYMTKVASTQVWGPSGSKYASFVKVKYLSTKQQKALSKKVNRIIKGISPSMTQAQKAEMIHDAINGGCTYDWVSYRTGRLAANSGNAVGCLVNGKSVCAGYADAFQLVALKAGLKCAYVSNGKHAWNLVRIDGKWYHIDLCWDDTGGDNRRWFLKGSETMASERYHGIGNCYPATVRVCAKDYVLPRAPKPDAGTVSGDSGRLVTART